MHLDNDGHGDQDDHDIGHDVDDCSHDIDRGPVDAGALEDGRVPVLLYRVAGEDQGEDDGEAIACHDEHDDVDADVEPFLRCQTAV